MECSHDLGAQQSIRKKKDSPSFLSRAQPMKRHRLFFDCTLWASFSSLQKCFPGAGTCMWLATVADFRLQFFAHLEQIHLCRRNNWQSLHFKSTFQWPIWKSENSSHNFGTGEQKGLVSTIQLTVTHAFSLALGFEGAFVSWIQGHIIFAFEVLQDLFKIFLKVQYF